MKHRIGFFGCGNMGSAILRGLLKKGVASPKTLWIFDVDPKKTTNLRRSLGVRIAKSPEELAQNVQIVILGTKPQQVVEAAGVLKPHLKGRILVSILAGTTLEKLRKYFGAAPKLVRVMPNLGAITGEAFSALSGRDSRALKAVKPIFETCGIAAVMPESSLNLVTALSGSGPAYFFLLTEFLEEVARKGGIAPEVARKLAVQTALGASRVAKESPYSPAELRKMVTSKGGTTEAALKVLESRGFKKIFKEAVQKAAQRAKELSR